MKQRPKNARKLIMLFLSLALLAVPIHKARAIGLKENSIVTGNTIKLSDVFDNVPENEDKILGISPQPGHDMVLNARTLLRIALALDLPWRPSSNADMVVLRRSASIIERSQIENQIKSALAKEGITENYSIDLSDEQSRIILPQDQPATLEVSNIALNPNRDAFEATISAPSAKNPVQQIKVTGKVQPMMSIPVLKSSMQNGETITTDNIEYKQIAAAQFSAGTITKTEDLIGMTPRHIITAGRPLKSSDMVAPQVIARGDYVTLVLNDGVLSLTAQGKALENGAKGEIIRVINTASNLTVQGLVSAEHEVQIIAD